MQGKKLIELSYILDIENYTGSLDRWLQMPIHIGREHQRQNCFDQYLHIVKPKIHNYEVVTALDPKQYGFYSKELKKGQLKVLLDSYKQLQRFETFSQDQWVALKQEASYSCVTQEEFKGLLPQLKMPIFRVQLSEKPKNKELPYWGNHLNVPPLTFQSVVIHGKGIARTTLGFPTANLHVTHQIEQRLNSYPNGIYVVRFTFLKGDSYFGICSIGTNPHYQNALNRRLAEVYIYNDFGESMFYGAEVSVTILVLTRLEGKFSSFDEFLNAMHNDIQSGRIIAEKVQKL